MVTVTDADVGQEAATEGVLEGIVMLTAPTQYDNDYFCLMDGDVILFNIHVATSAIGPGSVLLADGTISYQKLTLKSIPKGSSFELTMALPPVLSVLVPDTAVSGDPDFTLSCTGTGFTKGTVIKFGSNDEPTTFVSDTEVTTGVKPSLFAPAVVPVSVHTGTLTSDPLDFTFTEPVVEDTYKG
jgi:hypothetical protein